MKSLAVSVAFIALAGPALAAPKNSLLIEDMTWTELRDVIAAGKTTAIYYAASTEQNGPGVALGKHVFIAHYLSQRIAVQLGDALVYPPCLLLRREIGASPGQVPWILPKRPVTCVMRAA